MSSTQTDNPITIAATRPINPTTDIDADHGTRCDSLRCQNTATHIALWRRHRDPRFAIHSKQLCDKHVALWRAAHADTLEQDPLSLIV